MNKAYLTREEWLVAAINMMRPIFTSHNYPIPPIRVACGWPSSGGLSRKKRTLGQCWSQTAASDGVHQIFVSPFVENKPAEEDPYGVLPVLVHEVCHAVVGIEAKHGKVFRKCAEAVGLEGKMTSTTPGPLLVASIKEWQVNLGPYPHAKLDPQQAPVKKQATRMVKMVCLHKECGYLARTARKWLDEVGPAHCPKHGEMSVELPDEGEENDD